MRAAALLCVGFLGLIIAAPTAASPETETALRLEMRDFRFLPATVQLAVGRPATLRFVNRGQLAHQFDAGYLRALSITVADENTRVEAPGLDYLRLQPGGSASLRFVPRRRGRFEFACTIEGHREAGMKGTIVVR